MVRNIESEIIQQDTYNYLSSSAYRILRHLKGQRLEAIVTDTPVNDDRGSSSGVVILRFADKEVRLGLKELPNQPGCLSDVVAVEVSEAQDQWPHDWAVTPIHQNIRFLEALEDGVQVDGWNPDKPIFIHDARGLVLFLEDCTLVIDKEHYWSTCWHISIWRNSLPVIPNADWKQDAKDETEVRFSYRLFATALFPPYVSRLMPPQTTSTTISPPATSTDHHRSFMVVPKSLEIARHGFYTDQTTEDGYVFTEFSDEEQHDIFHLLMHFDDEFHILIDQYEEEEIKAEDVPTALAIARDFYESTEKINERKATQKVIQALELAASLKMPMWFWF